MPTLCFCPLCTPSPAAVQVSTVQASWAKAWNPRWSCMCGGQAPPTPLATPFQANRPTANLHQSFCPTALGRWERMPQNSLPSTGRAAPRPHAHSCSSARLSSHCPSHDFVRNTSHNDSCPSRSHFLTPLWCVLGSQPLNHLHGAWSLSSPLQASGGAPSGRSHSTNGPCSSSPFPNLRPLPLPLLFPSSPLLHSPPLFTLT